MLAGSAENILEKAHKCLLINLPPDIHMRIVKKVDVHKFIQGIEQTTILMSQHSLFRLHTNLRNIYKVESLQEMIARERPVFVGLQVNGLYAVYYAQQDGYLKIIMDIQVMKLIVVTLYIVEKNQLPRIK